MTGERGDLTDYHQMPQPETRGGEDVLKEVQLQRLFNDTPFMLTRCDRNLRYVFVSRAYADMLGRDPADIEGRLIADVMGPEGLEKRGAKRR